MRDSVISRNGFYISAIDANVGQLMYSSSKNIQVIMIKQIKLSKSLVVLIYYVTDVIK